MPDVLDGTVARIYLEGALIADGLAFGFDEAHEVKNVPTTLGGTRFRKAVKSGGYMASGTFSGVYTEGGAGRAVLAAAVRSLTPLTIVMYWEGITAGKPTTTFTALFSSLKHDASETGDSQPLSVSFSAVTAPVDAPNLALSVTAMGSVAAGGAASGYTTPVASGGTSTYALTIVRGVLPEGVSMSSGGVFSGTVDAGANVGTYLFEITVTDSAATPVVKVFLCSLIVTA